MTTDAERKELAAQGLTPIEDVSKETEKADGDGDGAGDEGDDEGDELSDEDKAAAAAAAEEAAKPKLSPEDQALVDAAHAEGVAEAETKAERRAREEAEERDAAANRERIAGLQTGLKDNIAKHVFTFKDGEGNDVQTTVAPAVLATVNKYIDDAYADMDKHLMNRYQEAIEKAVVKLVPADKRDEVQKGLFRAKDADELVQRIVDAGADQATVFKDRSLDDLVKLSPKAGRELATRIKLAKTEARKAGQADPAPEPEADGRAKNRTGAARLVDPHTPPQELAAMLASAGVR